MKQIGAIRMPRAAIVTTPQTKIAIQALFHQHVIAQTHLTD